MGIHADDLRDAEELAWDMHCIGQCEDWCHYCLADEQREKDRLADLEKLD